MIAEISVGCALGAVVVNEVVGRVRQHRALSRQEELVIRAIQQVASDPLSARPPQFSGRRYEMEALLVELESVSQALIMELAAEAELGEKHRIESFDSWLDPARLHEARTRVEAAQKAYIQTANLYREFVRSLPPPMRPKAIERASRSMAFGDGWLPMALG